MWNLPRGDCERLLGELVEAGYSVDGTADGEDSLGRFMRNLPIAARVDDWFFVQNAQQIFRKGPRFGAGPT